MSSSGRKHARDGAHPSGGSTRNHSAGSSHEPDSRKTPAKSSTGLRGKVAAFLRGSLDMLAKGHRATLGRVLKKKTDKEAPAKRSPHPQGHRPARQDKPRHAGPTRSGESSSRRSSSSSHRAPVDESSGPTHPPADCRWIATEEDFRSLVAEVRSAIEDRSVSRSYIDTEADSLHHYTEKLCLIQLAVDGKFYLIDTLALGDLSPLLSLLDQTEIWLHGADYDLTLLKKTYGWSPQRIYDTQIAARLCGNRPFGLAALVERHCGVVLCKSSQKADWSQRPLPAKMQAYAVDDVRYLGRLADIFISDLTAKNRLLWFQQSCAALRSDVLKRPDRDKEDAWRISGCGRLKPMGLAVLRELWLWRDTAAAERDVPPFKVLNNQQLLTMATDFESKGRAEHPPRWRSGWRDGFRAALERARTADPSTWPQQPRHKRRHITEAQKDRIESLCAYRDKKAETLGLESSLLGSRATIEAVVLQPESEIDAILMPWQKEVLLESGAANA